MISLVSGLVRGSAVVGAVFLVIALLKKLVVAVGLLVAIIKLAIVVIFVAVLVMIALAIYRDRQKRKSEL